MTVIIVMGVSGSGKTTVANSLAQRLGWQSLEGDTFHPKANVVKMSAGIPLTDADRWPWLQAIATRIDALREEGQSVVVACSALKRAYRAILLDGQPDAILLYLRGTKTLIAERMKERHNHFMPPALLDSQFATLEEPGVDEDPVVVDIGAAADSVIQTGLHLVQERMLRGKRT